MTPEALAQGGHQPPTLTPYTDLSSNNPTTMALDYNGWTNYETWNVALWIQNDQFLYNTAKACVEYCGENETPWDKFVRCMTDGQIGRHLVQTRDGVRWDNPAIDADEMNEMLAEM